MSRFRNSLLALLIHMAVFFNIERLDLGGKNVIDISAVVYILALCSVIVMLLVKKVKDLPLPILLAGWTMVFGVTKLAYLSNRPVIGGVYTYLTFTELSLFLLTIVMAYYVAINMADFEQVVENVTFSKVDQVKKIGESQEHVKNELYRSRRFQRPLSILVFEQDHSFSKEVVNRLAEEAQKAMINRYISVTIARELSKELRQLDTLLEYDDAMGRFLLLCPETNRDGLRQVISRINKVADKLGIMVNIGIASFPDEALTFETLLQQAELDLEQQEIIIEQKIDKQYSKVSN